MPQFYYYTLLINFYFQNVQRTLQENRRSETNIIQTQKRFIEHKNKNENIGTTTSDEIYLETAASIITEVVFLTNSLRMSVSWLCLPEILVILSVTVSSVTRTGQERSLVLVHQKNFFVPCVLLASNLTLNGSINTFTPGCFPVVHFAAIGSLTESMMNLSWQIMIMIMNSRLT